MALTPAQPSGRFAKFTFHRAGFAALGLLLCICEACSVGPKYERPATLVPPAYKENWKPAEPQDQIPKGAWWGVFQDPQLNALEQKLNISNQNLRQAQDVYLEARAAVRINRSSLFPTVTAGAAPTGARCSQTKQLACPPVNYADYLLDAQTSYEVDAWGQIRHLVEQSREQAQASAGDLETIRLSLASQLAVDYFTVRGIESEKQLLDSTVDAYQRALELTQSRFEGGVASREDVEQADTQLEQTRAQDIDLGVMRDELEHAIAVLTGQPPATFSLMAAPLEAPPPSIPAGMPSELLERRPDIAAAERRVAAANAQLGVVRAAYFPTLMLSAVGGFESGAFTSLLEGPSALWSVGGSALETVFDAGKRRGQTEQAKASYDQAVGNYQQTVLSAFQDVEDSLSDLRNLEQESSTQDAAVAAAQRSLDQATTRYTGGVDTYLSVITAQSVALSNQRTAIELLTRRMGSTVLLIKALGGGWDVSQLPSGN